MNPLIFLSGILVSTVIIGTCSAQGDDINTNSVIIGDYIYFDNSLQNFTREEAEAYCQAEGGELAKVWNRNLFYQMRIAVSRLGAYWIDGIDRDDEFRFDFERICPHRGEYLDYTGLPPNNLDLPQVSCLSLVKGTTVSNSKIQAARCTEKRYVVCQAPIEGCMQVGGD